MLRDELNRRLPWRLQGCGISIILHVLCPVIGRDTPTSAKLTANLYYLTINYSSKAKRILSNNPRDGYSTIFTEPEENNCFSIIAQVIIRATAFSFILLVSSLKTLEIPRRPF